jgi:hypothetical protein
MPGGRSSEKIHGKAAITGIWGARGEYWLGQEARPHRIAADYFGVWSDFAGDQRPLTRPVRSAMAARMIGRERIHAITISSTDAAKSAAPTQLATSVPP